jgi:hypothetical protein
MNSNTLFSMYQAAHDKHGAHNPITNFLGVSWLESVCLERGEFEIVTEYGQVLQFDPKQRTIH